MVNTQFFINYLENFSYIGIFILILLSGYLIPVPEEISLLLVGYIVGFGFNNIYAAMIASILGVLAGDNIIFWLSKYKGSRLINRLNNRLKRKIRKNEIAKYRHLMKKHIGKTIFILRFIVGLRFFAPFLAGSMKVKWKKFQFYNLLAVIIYVPMLVLLGYFFHNRLAQIITEVEIARHLFFLLFLMFAGTLISVFIKKKYLTNNKK